MKFTHFFCIEDSPSDIHMTHSPTYFMSLLNRETFLCLPLCIETVALHPTHHSSLAPYPASS